jgi:hypothetical protein
MTDPLHSQNLVPFKKNGTGYRLPGGARDEEEHLTGQVDPDLSPEEQGFVRHYLAYADTLLRNAPQEDSSQSKVTAMPDPEQDDSDGKAA